MNTFNKQFSGNAAGTDRVKNKKIYRYVQLGDKAYAAHRIVWVMFNGKFKFSDIDHIDGNSLNNNIENLRNVPRSENNKNIRLLKTNTSGVSGVSWRSDMQKWGVRIGINGVSKRLGNFIDFELAELVATEARELFGYHANHGKSYD